MRGKTMLDPFAQLCYHCWGHACASHMVSMETATHQHDSRICQFTNSYGSYPSQNAMPVLTSLGVVASICLQLSISSNICRTYFSQQCGEMLRPFARSVRGERMIVHIFDQLPTGLIVQLIQQCSVFQAWLAIFKAFFATA